MSGALARADLLEAQRDGWMDSTRVAQVLAGEAATAMSASFEEAVEERAEAAIAIADVRAELILQQGVSETSFRRAESLASQNPVLEQAIQEMRGDAIVESMRADSVIAATAAALLTAQLRIASLETLDSDKDEAHERVMFTLQTALDLEIQRGNELQNALAPGFLQKILQLPEVALVGAVVGATITLAVVSR